MLWLWLFASLLQGCLSYGLYPASAVSSVEAHGPLARLALQPHYDHVTSFQHQPSVAHIPVAGYSAQTAYEAPVYQVPTVAQVPVFKYTAQPGYVQRLVDVANAKVDVVKLQVRRPAIHKQFFDIEERTIVRPVGSAVLELEEPISKQFVSPFSVVPAGHHTITQPHRPLIYPVSSYPLVSYRPLEVPVRHCPPATIQQTVQTSQQYPILLQPPQQFPSTSHQQPQQHPSTSGSSQQFPHPQQPVNTEPRPPQQFPFVTKPPSDDSLITEHDSSDSVVVENPDFTKSSKSNENPQLEDNNEDSFAEFEKEVSKDQNEQERIVQNIISDFENLHLLKMFQSQTRNEKPLQRSQQRPNFQILLEPPKTPDQSLQIQKKPSEETQSFQRSKDTRLEGSDVLTQTENSIETSSALTSAGPSSLTTEREHPNLYSSYLDYLQDDQADAAKPHSTSESISSERNINAEELQENQRKLLELLTGRGEVSEVALARSAESVVRGRVSSVTTAPCVEGKEQVNTRRIVVSRPVHTVQEVDLHRPFTHVERVAVHEPLHTLHYH